MILFLLRSIDGMEWNSVFARDSSTSTACVFLLIRFLQNIFGLPPPPLPERKTFQSKTAAHLEAGLFRSRGTPLIHFNNGLLFLLNVATNKAREQFKTIWEAEEDEPHLWPSNLWTCMTNNILASLLLDLTTDGRLHSII